MEEDETSKSVGSVRNSRPHITLRIPPPTPGSTNSRPPTLYYTGPLTPTAVDISDGGVNVFTMYPGKAGQFVSKQFLSFRDFTLKSAKSGLSVGEKASFWMYGKVWALSRKWFTHFFLFAIVAAYSLLGGFVFMKIEGNAEEEAYLDIIAHRRNLVLHIQQLYEQAQPLRTGSSDDLLWQGSSMQAIIAYEDTLLKHFKQDSKILSKGDKPTWDFWSSVFYCGTIFTTIGYGHIAPVTNSGRALTIAYSIIGIPLFLILLADFGKLFTRGIKFLWAFVRRVYYTGSCRTVRRTAPVQEVMKGMQLVYESIRRPSMFTPDGDMKECGGGGELGGVTPGDPPSTPALSAFAIDDEFNLPISVAIFILLIYIFLGATVFWIWEEDWSFFEAFYFVFISMSTIGFGDLVPKNQMYMMASIVYLAFGLALTSMCINVVQEKLSDTFRKASAKIGATIGLKVSDDDGTISPVTPTHVEIAEVHKSTLNPPPQVP